MFNEFFFSNPAAPETRSLRFDRDADARLTRTPSSAGSDDNFTFSCWIKLGELAESRAILSGYDNTNNRSLLFLGTADKLGFETRVFGLKTHDLESRGVLRDPSAWYHIVLSVASSDSTARLYLNNVLEDSDGATRTFINTTDDQAIGIQASALNFPFDGLMAEVYLIDGTAEDPTDFGEYNTNGQWVPKAYSGGASYGTNGFYLDFLDNSSTSALGEDKSGNGNDWTTTNLSVTTGSGDDSFIDTPTNNFATLNPLDGHPSGVDHANLDATSANAYPTIIPESGSWYYEVDGTGYTWDGTRAGWTPRSGSHNFGQRTFSGTATAATLCTANLTAPTIADGSTAMSVVLDTGANILTSAQNAIGGSADLIWIKDRANSSNHQLIDTVRGGTATLRSNSTSSETTYQTPTGNSVAWTWDAGDSTVSNTDGTISSTVRASQANGFSIVTYTGTGSSATVGHGLNAAPDVVLIKNRDNTDSWQMYHIGTGSGARLRLDSDNAKQTSSTYFNNTAPTSSVFSLGSNNAGNGSGDDMVAYCWASVDGFSSFGTYDGNGDAEGPFVNLNFRPAWLMIKRANSSTGWFIFDSEREGYNMNNDSLRAESIGDESATDYLDLLSNGFAVRASTNPVNSSSGDYIYMAFAESPFRYSNAR